MLSFSKAQNHQLEAIHGLMQDAFTSYVQKLQGNVTAGPYPWLRAAIDESRVDVCLEDRRIVGVVATGQRGDELIIRQIGVNPEKQGKGIGSYMLQQVERLALANAMKSLSLHTAAMMHDLRRLY